MKRKESDASNHVDGIKHTSSFFINFDTGIMISAIYSNSGEPSIKVHMTDDNMLFEGASFNLSQAKEFCSIFMKLFEANPINHNFINQKNDHSRRGNIWTKAEKSTAADMIKNKKDIYTIATALNRTERAVREMAYRKRLPGIDFSTKEGKILLKTFLPAPLRKAHNNIPGQCEMAV